MDDTSPALVGAVLVAIVTAAYNIVNSILSYRTNRGGVDTARFREINASAVELVDRLERQLKIAQDGNAELRSTLTQALTQLLARDRQIEELREEIDRLKQEVERLLAIVRRLRGEDTEGV